MDILTTGINRGIKEVSGNTSMSSLYEIYKDHPKEELFAIVVSRNDYNPEVLTVVHRIIKENNWRSELTMFIEDFQHSKKLKEKRDWEELESQSKFYKDSVEFKRNNLYHEARISHIPMLESQLIENEIPFFREDNEGRQNLSQTQVIKYYFKPEDADSAFRLISSLKFSDENYYPENRALRAIFLLMTGIAALTMLFIILFT